MKEGDRLMWIAALVVLILIAAWVMISYNRLVSLRDKNEKAFLLMDTNLKRMHDIVPELVETVKSHAVNEREALEKVVQARSMAMSSENIKEMQFNEHMLSSAINSLLAAVEGYPEMKTDDAFVQLKMQLHNVENDISNSKRDYNELVKAFNIKIENPPFSMIAGIFGLSRYPYFMVD